MSGMVRTVTSTITGEEYNHPAPTIEYVYDTIPDPDDPTVVTIIRIPIEVHTDHNVTINIHRDTYHHYLSGPCN